MKKPSERLQACADLIGDVDPYPFSKSIGSSDRISEYLDKFDDFLEACGVRYFSALEVCTPSSSSQEVASRTGSIKSMHRGQFVLVYPVLLWQPMACVVVLADEIREALGAPITLRNGMRPWWINQQVAGSGIASDHPMTAAVDLDLSKSGDLSRAHAKARSLYDLHAEDLDISLGLGETVVHLGIHSPHGHRRWSY